MFPHICSFIEYHHVSICDGLTPAAARSEKTINDTLRLQGDNIIAQCGVLVKTQARMTIWLHCFPPQPDIQAKHTTNLHLLPQPQ